MSVSPGLGSRGTVATRSRLIDPTTRSEADQAASARRSSRAPSSRFSRRSKRPGPERVAVGRRLEPRRVGEALERADEHGELQVGVRDAVRRSDDAGSLEDGVPLDDLTRPGSPYQERPSAPCRLELEQVATRAAARGPRAPSRLARRPGGRPPGAARACRARARPSPSARGGRQKASPATSLAVSERIRRAVVASETP